MLAAGPRGQACHVLQAHTVGDEVDAAVAEQDVDAAGVPASGRLQAVIVGGCSSSRSVEEFGMVVVVVSGREIAAVDPAVAALAGIGGGLARRWSGPWRCR